MEVWFWVFLVWIIIDTAFIVGLLFKVQAHDTAIEFMIDRMVVGMAEETKDEH